jgi:hypothetical protein
VTVLAATAIGVAGCCLSQQQVDGVRKDLLARNLAHAEPEMHAAAERRGAVLLPVEAQHVLLPPPCNIVERGVNLAGGYPYAPESGWKCEAAVSATDDRRLFRLKDDRGKVWLGIEVAWTDRPYARLARRGSTVFLLEPRITRKNVGAWTQCECDGMPRVVYQARDAFVIDDIPSVKIEIVEVPMTEESVDWDCKTIGL